MLDNSVSSSHPGGRLGFPGRECSACGCVSFFSFCSSKVHRVEVKVRDFIDVG
jgi:hypothetical protein